MRATWPRHLHFHTLSSQPCARLFCHLLCLSRRCAGGCLSLQNHALRSRGHALLENSCTRGCYQSPARSCPSRTPCRCATALDLTDPALPWLIGIPFTYRFAQSPPLYPICLHAAEHPSALLTRSFRLPGADCCAAISPRAVTSTAEQLKPRGRGREALWCVPARCTVMSHAHQ